jgi:hypothetical protein
MRRAKRSLKLDKKVIKNIETILICCHRVEYLLEFHDIDWIDVLDNLEFIRDTARDSANDVGLDIEDHEAERQHREDNSNYNSSVCGGLR